MEYFLAPEENRLIERCLQNDRRAQRLLYERYVQAMYHLALRLTGTPEDAEDVLQEAFVRVFQKLSTFKQHASLGAWIKRIVINTSMNHLRRKRPVVLSDPETLGETPQAPAPPERAYSLENIHQAIQKLPDGARTILTLYLLEGYRHQEIAEIMEISVSTSKTQYARGRRMLRQLLEQQAKSKKKVSA